MTLIKSISGIRGTIGGRIGEGLNPADIVKFTTAYGMWVKNKSGKKRPCVVVGRDARISGHMVNNLVTGTLSGIGCDVLDIGLATTPTVEIAVPYTKADGGLILTASHNPRQWNALKMLNSLGEFLNDAEGKEIIRMVETTDFVYADIDNIGQIKSDNSFTEKHIEMVLNLPAVDKKAIKDAGFTIAIDAVNSVGGIAIPALLKALGVKKIIELYCTPDGNFPHNPEPLPEHLTEISALVKKEKASVGIVVDPDVDRLAIVCEDGSMFGEEYTLVAVADYILSLKKGNTVSNLSSTRALRDITEKAGGTYTAAAVGEVNVVKAMKDTQAVIGGEGNGGVIYPDLHYGRDALVGVALFLTHLAKSKLSCTQLRATYPAYVISKNKIELKPGTDVDKILLTIKEQYKQFPVNDIDGVKIEMGKDWVHLRKSNTEPIIRIYAESTTREKADERATEIIKRIKEIAGL